ncbi:MAG: DNA mismatch repair endonuclease MutL [Elusimicrobiota bacterium]|jgi:DNA mismatch repair protein MutL|nr:DNA mismatch repair endonuclease MutL [Elusimicrobiota bacterium]
MPINLLSQETIDKIAAGEVVERPLNAVKELVENSLDAFADVIIVEIETAGKKLIRVSDNGLGIGKEDLERSILRHATSKIENFEDLYHINSMGFRGEALASISAVSHFEMKTIKKGETSGWKLSCQGGKNIQISPWAGAQGTITEIRNLFFNVPVRQKFLKSDVTERSKIIACLEETALANQEVSFKVLSENRSVISATKTDKKTERISDILGKDFAKTIKVAKIEHPNIAMEIYFTGRNDCLQNKKFQYLFVNSRPVNYSKRIMHSVYNAYRGSIPLDKHPGILIYINIDPCEIDVNISPTKREVKFADENAVYDIIFKTLKNAVAGHPHCEISIGSISKEADKATTACNGFSKSNTINYNFNSNNSYKKLNEFVSETKENNYVVSNKSSYDINKYANIFLNSKKNETDNFDIDTKVIGQVFENYIIVEKQQELYIFDQHACAERIKYESFLSQIKDKAILSQTLLMPENIEITAASTELLKANLPLLNELGFFIEEFGQNTFRITTYPALLGDISASQTVKKIMTDIEYDKSVQLEKRRETIIRSSCKASTRSGDKMAFLETKKLIKDLFKCENPFTCPHGRPTAYKISLSEIEKFFKRK